MLSRSSYPIEHIERSRRHIDERIAAWDGAFSGGCADVASSLETAYFTDLVLVLDAHFIHRGRGIEGKDGNPLNEVRVLCNSLVEHDGVLSIEGQIKLRPETSVLGLKAGDQIAIGRADFGKLTEAFLKEIEARYPAE